MQRLRLGWLVVLLVVATGCTQVRGSVSSEVRPAVTAVGDDRVLPASRGPSASGIFAIDILVRSTQLPGIDMHLRYAERTPAGLVLHLAFYNNGSSELAFVQGADPRAARLLGASPETPTARSPSLDATIAPGTAWPVGGATNGTLTFAAAAGPRFTLLFPGFPAVSFRLDTPLRAAPDPPPVENATYRYDFEAESERFPGLVLVVERLAVTASKLDIEVALDNRGDRPFSLQAGPNGKDALVLDGRWGQYAPVAVDPALGAGAGPDESVLRAAESRSGVLRFPRPAAGPALLLRYPGFPLIRLPLSQDEEAALATAPDLPPSAEPRLLAEKTAQPAQDPSAQAHAAAARIVASLSRKLDARDRDGFLAAFMPSLRPQERALFDRMLSLPLSDITFAPTGGGTLVGDELRGFRVICTYRVRDVDPSNLFTAALEVTFRRDKTQWHIAALGGALPFWAIGPTEAQRLGAFWVFFRPALRTQLPAIAQETGAALRRVQQALPGRAADVNVMFVTQSPAEFGLLTGRDPARFLGVALSRYYVETGDIQVGSAAFYINGAAFGADPRRNRQQTITHELTHLALARETMPYTPLWLVEGMAMEVSQDLPVATMSALVRSGDTSRWSLAALSAKGIFGGDDASGQQTGIDYAYSAYLARYLVATYGFDRFLAFYDSFADIPFDDLRTDLSAAQRTSSSDQTLGALAAKLTPTQIREVFGVDLSTLERDFKTWLPSQVGVGR